ncbi:MAG: glycosyl hydrolase family 18 protein [Eubacteriales bacterium]
MENIYTFNPACPNLKRIAGEYVLGSPLNTDPYLLDFAIYAFAMINQDGSFSVYSQKHLQELANLRMFNPELKVIMAIGGWGAEGFSDAALTPQSRFDFAREAQKWVKEYELDGIDLDWEYPRSSMAGIKSRISDTENFTLLIEALRIVLGDSAWISVAGIADNNYIRNVEIRKIGSLINYFNVMTYDFTAGSTGVEGDRHQSNLYTSSLSLNNISVDIYVRNLVNAGMPSEKILVGLPFYGRRGSSITRTFDDIRNNYMNNEGYLIEWDDAAKVPYIVDSNGNFILSYDDELSIYYKGQYVIDNCLGGMFSWQSNFDQANILARTMNYAVKDPLKLEEMLVFSR